MEMISLAEKVYKLNRDFSIICTEMEEGGVKRYHVGVSFQDGMLGSEMLEEVKTTNKNEANSAFKRFRNKYKYGLQGVLIDGR